MHIRPITDIQGYSPVIGSLLQASCEANGDRYTVDDCLLELYGQEKFCWMADSIGLAVAQIIEFPNKRCGIIDACSGERFSEWGKPMLEQIEAWMRLNQCAQVMVVARKGFAPFFKSMGYVTNQSVFEKEL